MLYVIFLKNNSLPCQPGAGPCVIRGWRASARPCSNTNEEKPNEEAAVRDLCRRVRRGHRLRLRRVARRRADEGRQGRQDGEVGQDGQEGRESEGQEEVQEVRQDGQNGQEVRRKRII